MTAETTYVPDPQPDRILNLVWQLAGELQVTRQRLAALEAVLARTGTVPAGTVDGFHPHPSEAESLRRHRDEYVDRLTRAVAEHGTAEPSERSLREQWLPCRPPG